MKTKNKFKFIFIIFALVTGYSTVYSNTPDTDKKYIEFVPRELFKISFDNELAGDDSYEFGYKNSDGYDVYIKKDTYRFFEEMEKAKGRVEVVFPSEMRLRRDSNRLKRFEFLRKELVKRGISKEPIPYKDKTDQYLKQLSDAENEGRYSGIYFYENDVDKLNNLLGNIINATNSAKSIQNRSNFFRILNNGSVFRKNNSYLGEIGGDAFLGIKDIDLELQEVDGKWQCLQKVRFSNGSTGLYKSSLSLCENELPSEYRWRNDNKDVCVESIVDTSFEIREVKKFHCEENPKIKEFFILKNDYLTSCKQNVTCLNIAPNEEIKKITSSLVDIVKEIEIGALEEKVKQNENIEFNLPLTEAISKMDALVYECNAINIEKITESLDSSRFYNLDKKETQETRIRNDITGIREGIFEIITDEAEAKTISDKFVNMYSECIIKAHKKAAKGEKSFSLDQGNQFSHEDIANCSYLTSYNIDKFLYDKKLRPENELASARNYFLQNEASAKNFGEGCMIPFNLKYGRGEITEITDPRVKDNFSRYFDMKSQIGSCFVKGRTVRDKFYSGRVLNEKGEIYPGLELNNQSRARISDEIENCEKAGQSYSNCLEQSVVSELSSLSLRASVVKPEIAQKYNYNPVIRDRYLSLISESPKLRNCFDQIKNAGDQDKCSKAVEKFIDDDLNSVTGKVGNYSMNPAVALLTADIKRTTRTLKHDISSFHYHTFSSNDNENRNESNEPEEDDSIALAGEPVKAYAYAKARGSVAMMNPLALGLIPVDDGGTMAGRGLYTATDPYSTDGFGNTMLKVDLKKGQNYMDMRHNNGRIGLSYATYKALEKQGCNLSEFTQDSLDAKANDENQEYQRRQQELIKETSQQQVQQEQQEQDQSNEYTGPVYIDESQKDNVDGVYVSVHKSVFEIDVNCHGFFSQAISKLDIKFLSYPYGNRKMDFCDGSAKKTQSVAFVMLNADLLGNTKLYNKEGLTEIVTKVENGEQVDEEAMRVAQLKGLLPHTSESKKYWKDNLYQCSSKYKSEEHYREEEL